MAAEPSGFATEDSTGTGFGSGSWLGFEKSPVSIYNRHRNLVSITTDVLRLNRLRFHAILQGLEPVRGRCILGVRPKLPKSRPQLSQPIGLRIHFGVLVLNLHCRDSSESPPLAYVCRNMQPSCSHVARPSDARMQRPCTSHASAIVHKCALTAAWYIALPLTHSPHLNH